MNYERTLLQLNVPVVAAVDHVDGTVFVEAPAASFQQHGCGERGLEGWQTRVEVGWLVGLII